MVGTEAYDFLLILEIFIVCVMKKIPWTLCLPAGEEVEAGIQN
jgi:hypothetical protein